MVTQRIKKGQPNPKDLAKRDICEKLNKKVRRKHWDLCRNKRKKSFRKIIGTLNEIAGDVIPQRDKTKIHKTWRDI